MGDGGPRSWWKWLWSSQHVDLSNVEIVQLRIFQLGSIVGAFVYVFASVWDQIASLFR